MQKTFEPQIEETDVFNVSEMFKVRPRPTFSLHHSLVYLFIAWISFILPRIQGNFQRCRLIADTLNDARQQILKVFEHKTYVSDIIHRCASKRNLKKREKP